MDLSINYVAVVAAAVASLVVGFLWYGVLFKKQWMSLMGITHESVSGMKMSANQAYFVQFIASLIMAYVLAHSLVYANPYLSTRDLGAGLLVGFWNWLGFVMPVTLGMVLWENKPWKLWLLNASNYLVSLMVMGAILSLWK
jgi:hypothetical protein